MKTKYSQRKNLANFIGEEHGGTLAELAILVPILAVMLAAVSEFGRFFQTYTTLSKATRSAARYLSNHPFTGEEQDKAKNLVVCGKLTACAENERLVPGLDTTKICIETTGSPKIQTITVRIPRTADGCGAPHNYEPIFDIGALLHTSFNLRVPIAPSTTMRYLLDS